ncbi:putative type VI secretion system effector [Photorhabdus asymbiotica]|uniref:putative type VI secretion system effector n=1 Tax=Photorhabdus asymbiotica TaxID=291112 RepID=UPI003DA7665F
MSTFRPYKEAINFDEIKDQRKDIDILVKVKRERIQRRPEDREEVEKSIAELQAKIPELDAILAKEPPPPELPPRKPLIKVSGVLEEIETLCVMGYFTDREYDPEAFARKEERDQYGALLLAMAGNTSAAAINSQTSVRMWDVCDFVRGKINGVPFHGWLGFTTAKVGDYVELAVTEQEGYYVVYAIAHPELRVVSMTPRCQAGILSDAKEQIFGTCFLFSLYLLVLIMAEVFFIRKDILVLLEYMLPFCILMIAIFAPSTYYSRLKKPRPTVKLAEEIFTVLGFPDPTNLNICQFTKKKIKEIKANSLDEGPGKESEKVLPDKACFASHYYYY